MSTTTDEAAQLLLAAWKGATRINGLPSRCRPADLDQGYAIQDALLLATGEALGGHKIAATSLAGQQHIGITHPITGGLLSSQIRSPGAQVSLSGNQMCAAEAEFVFEFKARVSPRSTQYSRVEVLQAVGALRLGIEIPDSRLSGFAGAGAPQLVADNACAHLFVLGQVVASGWRQNDLSARLLEAVDDSFDVTHSALFGIDQHDHLVGIGSTGPSRGHHCAFETALGREYPWGVDIDHLNIVEPCDTEDATPGSLHLRRDD